MFTLGKNGFLTASALCAGLLIAAPAQGQEANPPEPPKIGPPQDKLNYPPRLQSPLPEAFTQSSRQDIDIQRMEYLEKKYKDQRIGRDMDFGDGVYGDIKPMKFRLTILLGPARN